MKTIAIFVVLAVAMNLAAEEFVVTRFDKQVVKTLNEFGASVNALIIPGTRSAGTPDADLETVSKGLKEEGFEILAALVIGKELRLTFCDNTRTFVQRIWINEEGREYVVTGAFSNRREKEDMDLVFDALNSAVIKDEVK